MIINEHYLNGTELFKLIDDREYSKFESIN